MQKNRTQRKLPGGSPPVVTYSRHREDELAAYDDGRAEPRFEDDPVAEWEAVEVPPEPPLHARRRARPMVDDVDPPRDRADFEDRPSREARPKRSTPLRLVAVAAAALVAIAIALLAYSFSSSTTVTTSAPALNEGGAAPGTVPADGDVANVTPVVREIPLTGSGDGAGGATKVLAPAEPPAPRVRPEPPASAANAVEPDFDQAAPLAPAEAPLAAAPADGTSDDAFISLIERTLAESGGAAPQPPALSPATEPGLLAPQALDPNAPIPPEDIPMVDGEGQPLTLPQDFLIDTE